MPPACGALVAPEGGCCVPGPHDKSLTRSSTRQTRCQLRAGRGGRAPCAVLRALFKSLLLPTQPETLTGKPPSPGHALAAGLLTGDAEPLRCSGRSDRTLYLGTPSPLDSRLRESHSGSRYKLTRLAQDRAAGAARALPAPRPAVSRRPRPLLHGDAACVRDAPPGTQEFAQPQSRR